MDCAVSWHVAGLVGLGTKWSLSLHLFVNAVVVQDFLKVSLRMMGRLSLCNWRLKHAWLTTPHMKLDPMPEPPSWDRVKVTLYPKPSKSLIARLASVAAYAAPLSPRQATALRPGSMVNLEYLCAVHRLQLCLWQPAHGTPQSIAA